MSDQATQTTQPTLESKDPLYEGTKRLHARPMKLGEYNTYRGWITPMGEDPEAQGYLVEYTDGGKPNHKDHAGYISWSPKDVFDKTYHIIGGVSVEGDLVQMHTLDDFAQTLMHWHATQVAELEHFVNIPEGMELSMNEGAPITLSGDIHKAFILGVKMSLSKLGVLPFIATSDESIELVAESTSLQDVKAS